MKKIPCNIPFPNIKSSKEEKQQTSANNKKTKLAILLDKESRSPEK